MNDTHNTYIKQIHLDSVFMKGSHKSIKQIRENGKEHTKTIAKHKQVKLTYTVVLGEGGGVTRFQLIG